MHFANILTTSVLIWTSVIVALPESGGIERRSEHGASKPIVPIEPGDKLILSRGAAAKTRLEDHQKELSRLDTEYQQTAENEFGERLQLEKLMHPHKPEILTLKRKVKELEYVGKHGLQPGRFEKVLKDFNDLKDYNDPDDEIGLDKKDCVAFLVTSGGDTEVVETTGAVWNYAISWCELEMDLLIHPDEKILFGMNNDEWEEFIGGYPKKDEDPKKNIDHSKSDFASVGNLFRNGLNRLTDTVGGAMRKGQQRSGSGMSAGTMPAGRFGGVPIGGPAL
ncbi:MAG: hypothetical protein M1816_005819 [Peltula sp. TS41687]|nr:MAG: hypothetical protein M1816_005819 [Peltula sp. TS41687]